MKVKLILTLLVMFMATSVFAQRTLNPENIKTITGTIINVNHPVAKFKADDGTEYDVRMGPYWYWENNNYSLTTNISATIKGETSINNSVNEIYPFEIEQNGTTIKLADEKGFTLWSNGGKGWNKGKGYGWKKGNGKGWGGRGQCWRKSENSNDNSGWLGRGFRNRSINCPYRNK